MVDIRQTPKYANYLVKIGWEVVRVAEINYFIKKVPLLGSVLKVQRPAEIKIQQILEIAKKYRAFHIIIEPKDMVNVKWLKAKGFKLSKSPYIPTRTLYIDLTLPINRLIIRMKKDARVAISRNIGHKLEFTINENVVKNEANEVAKGGKNQQNTIGLFRVAWKATSGVKRYVPPLSHLLALKTSFEHNCLFLAAHLPRQSGSVAGAIFLHADGVTYYWQAFTNKEGRKSLAQYKVVWEGIKWAKSRGAKIFDFEGIYDERFPNKSWLGFTHFKKSFGGYTVKFPGCYTRLLNPLRH